MKILLGRKSTLFMVVNWAKSFVFRVVLGQIEEAPYLGDRTYILVMSAKIHLGMFSQELL